MSHRHATASDSNYSVSSPRHLVLTTLLTLVLAVLPMWRLGLHAAAAVDDPDAPSVAGANAEVIAEGVATLPADQIAWRLVQDTAEPLGQAIFEQRALGFAVATDDALLLTDQADGRRTRLAAGESAFSVDGIMEMRESLGAAASPYLRIGLVAASDASDPNGDTLVYAGDHFASPSDDRDIELVAVRLKANEKTTIQSDFPALVVVLTGSVTASGTNLAAGDAATLDGAIKLEATAAGTRVLVALIGTQVPSAGSAPIDNSGGNGGSQTPTPDNSGPTSNDSSSIVFSTHLCPPGITPEQATDNSTAPCFDSGPADNVAITITHIGDGDIQSSTVYSSNGYVLIPDLPPGTYLIQYLPPNGFGATVGVCGGMDQSADLPVIQFSDSQVQLELPADRQYMCDSKTTQLGDAGGGDLPYINAGEIGVLFFACPDGMTLATLNADQCTEITDGFDFGFQASDGDLHLSDATFDGYSYSWDGLRVYADNNSGYEYSQKVWSFPAGYTTWASTVEGAPIQAPHAGGIALTTDHPIVGVNVFFFTA